MEGIVEKDGKSNTNKGCIFFSPKKEFYILFSLDIYKEFKVVISLI